MNKNTISSINLCKSDYSLCIDSSNNTLWVKGSNFHPISVDTLFDENDKLKKEIKELRHIIASMNTKINHLTLQINQLNK